MKPLFLILPAAALLGVSCERHEFEGPNGSKQLHEHHAPAEHEGGGAVHEEKAEH